MQIIHASNRRPVAPSSKIMSLLDTISAAQLRQWVERISVPRHFGAEPEQNRAIAHWLQNLFEEWGYCVQSQGQYSNIIATPRSCGRDVLLVGAHYDSVPMCPGADDNGSAVAAMLGCAASCSLWRPELPIVFTAFNCEEDGLKGSRDFVESFLTTTRFRVRAAHILEMVGFASAQPGSQRVPSGLPVRISDVGDFLGLLANGASSEFMEFVLRRAVPFADGLPVIGLKIRLGLEKFFPVLGRSDHAPFWMEDIPAVMWTDTSEFRNPNYHRHTDTPDTLDYEFLRRVTRLLTACAIEQASQI